MIWRDVLSGCLLTAGLFFFLAGTVGLWRFPDLYCRLHALTKADNVGLGFVVLALMVRAESALVAFKLALIWVLVLVASTTVCFLIGNEAWRRGQRPWTRSAGNDGDGDRRVP